METAILYGFLSGSALVIGSLVGLYMKVSSRVIAMIMAFGCGVLISALSIDLMMDAFELNPNKYLLSIFFILGASIFVGGNYLISKNGGGKRRHTYSPSEEKNLSGKAIILGTLLDGIPESLVMGSLLATGNGGGFVFVVAVFLSNFPEGISGSIAMKNSGINKLKIISVWIGLSMVSIIFTTLGYQFLGGVSESFKSSAMAFASGAILAMISDTMMPEAYKEGGNLTAFFVSIGFMIAFLLTKFF